MFAAARALPVGTLLGKEELGTIEIDVTEIDEDHIEYEKNVRRCPTNLPRMRGPNPVRLRGAHGAR